MNMRETVEENESIFWFEDKLEAYLYCAGKLTTEEVLLVVGPEKKMEFLPVSWALAEVLGSDHYFNLGDIKKRIAPEDISDIVDDSERFYGVPVRIIDWDGESLEERI